MAPPDKLDSSCSRPVVYVKRANFVRSHMEIRLDFRFLGEGGLHICAVGPLTESGLKISGFGAPWGITRDLFPS